LREERLEPLVQMARELGATGSKAISTEEVSTDHRTRWKCFYPPCKYGKSLMCPPHTPPAEETARLLKDYRYAILIHMNVPAVRANIPVAKRRLEGIVEEVERRAFQSGFVYALGLKSGPCELCEECTMDRCRHPMRARPSMEAVGIDVVQTARKAGFEIEFPPREEYNFFGLVLVG
jgi:predicted metal-binding protein